MKLDSHSEDWEFNVLGVARYGRPDRLTGYFDFIIENHAHLPGDICEVGVFQGSSLLATALLLRELGSAKIVWGFDTFAGFPPYDAMDELARFDEMYASGAIDAEHYRKVKLNQAYRQLVLNAPLNPANISTSGNFSRTTLELLQKKIEYLELDNIRLVKGDFRDTMPGAGTSYPPFFAALLDCDLYAGHQAALPFVWDHLVLGGYVFLDEYYSLKFPGARLAIDAFFQDKRDRPQQHRQLPGEFQRWYVRKILDRSEPRNG